MTGQTTWTANIENQRSQEDRESATSLETHLSISICSSLMPRISLLATVLFIRTALRSQSFLPLFLPSFPPFPPLVPAVSLAKISDNYNRQPTTLLSSLCINRIRSISLSQLFRITLAESPNLRMMLLTLLIQLVDLEPISIMQLMPSITLLLLLLPQLSRQSEETVSDSVTSGGSVLNQTISSLSIPEIRATTSSNRMLLKFSEEIQ